MTITKIFSLLLIYLWKWFNILLSLINVNKDNDVFLVIIDSLKFIGGRNELICLIQPYKN